jgi:hypothetical protein
MLYNNMNLGCWGSRRRVQNKENVCISTVFAAYISNDLDLKFAPFDLILLFLTTP